MRLLQAAALAASTSLPPVPILHLSAGDLLRLEVLRGSDKGREINKAISEGTLVPPSMVSVTR